MLWYAIDSSAMKIWDYVCHAERSQNKPQQWVPVVKNCESSVPCLTFLNAKLNAILLILNAIYLCLMLF